MTTARGTTNTNVRGSAADRRRRKQLLLDRDGDGISAPCWECDTLVTFETMICDRIKPGVKGGRYGLGNIRVHCPRCSQRQGARMSLETCRWKSWERRGLHRTRVGPEGFRNSGRWYVELDGELIGHVDHHRDGTGWFAMLYGQHPHDWRQVADCRPTLREALYALLLEYTVPERVAA